MDEHATRPIAFEAAISADAVQLPPSRNTAPGEGKAFGRAGRDLCVTPGVSLASVHGFGVGVVRGDGVGALCLVPAGAPVAAALVGAFGVALAPTRADVGVVPGTRASGAAQAVSETVTTIVTAAPMGVRRQGVGVMDLLWSKDCVPALGLGAERRCGPAVSECQARRIHCGLAPDESGAGLGWAGLNYLRRYGPGSRAPTRATSCPCGRKGRRNFPSEQLFQARARSWGLRAARSAAAAGVRLDQAVVNGSPQSRSACGRVALLNQPLQRP